MSTSILRSITIGGRLGGFGGLPLGIDLFERVLIALLRSDEILRVIL